MSDSPAAILFDISGNLAVRQPGSSSTNLAGVMMAGSDGSFVRLLKTDAAGAVFITGSLSTTAPPVTAVTGSVSVYTQGAQLISGTVTATITSSLPVTVSGTVNLDRGNSAALPLFVTGTFSTTAPLVTAVTGAVSVYTQGAQLISGNVNIGNWPPSMAVTGSQLTGSTFSGFPVVVGGISSSVSGAIVKALLTDASGALYVTTSGSIPVTVAGQIGVNNFPAVQAISGSVGVYTQGAQLVSGTVTITATSSLPVIVSGTVNLDRGNSAALPLFVSGSFSTTAPLVTAVTGAVSVYTQGAQLVSGNVNLGNWPSVIAVSGSQLTGSTFAGSPVVVGGISSSVSGSVVKALLTDASGALYVTTSGSLSVAIVAPVSVYDTGVRAVSGSVSVYTQGAQLISGTVTATITSSLPVTVSGTVNLDRGNSAAVPLFITGTLSTTAPLVTAVTGAVSVYTQGAQLISGTVTATITSSLPVTVSGTVNLDRGNSAAVPLFITGTLSTTAPLVTAVTGAVSVYTQGAQLVSGSVNVGNWPPVLAVTGSQLTGSTFAGFPVVIAGITSSVSGALVQSIKVDTYGAVCVTGSVTIATVTTPIKTYDTGITAVSGSVSVYTQGAQLISGTVTATITSSLPVTVSGTVNLDRGNSAALPLFITGSLSTTAPPVTAVTGSVSVYTQGAQLVSGTVTVTITSSLPVTVSGTVNLDRGNSAALPLFITGSLSTTAPPVTAVTGSVSVYTQGAQLVSGNVNIGNWPPSLAVTGSQVTGSTFAGFPIVVGGVTSSAAGPIVKALQTDVSGNQLVKVVPSITSTIASISALTTSCIIASGNVSRLGITIFNDSPSVLFVKLGTTATTASFSVRMLSNAYYEVPFAYTGEIDGIWLSPTGSARVTELTY